MRIGLVTPPNKVGQMSLAELLYQVEQAEADGFASYWMVQLPTTGNDTLTAIALAGQKTNRIELGTAVVSAYARHPLTLAQQALTTQLATGGRLSLGVGLSHQPVIENIMGLSYDKPARYMREYLSVLRPLINQESVSFSGQEFNINASLQTSDAPPCPVLIAALAPLMLRMAGEIADGTVTWMAGHKTIATHIVPKITAAAAAAGRAQPRVCVGLPIVVTDNPDEARAQLNQAIVRYGQLANYRRMLDIEDVTDPADVAIIGNEEEVTATLQALADVGATDFIASIFVPETNRPTEQTRTWAFLKSLRGEI